MLKYNNLQVTFSEVPNEISLYITISNCPIHCPLCNSKHLWKDEGKILNWDSLNAIIHINHGITCICFGGGDSEPSEVNKLAWHIKRSTDLKVCWYSGYKELPNEIDIKNFDMIKLGPFEGYPLDDPRTNQRFFVNVNNNLVDKTFLFWKTCSE